MTPLTLLMLLFAASGLVLIGISIPLIQRRIKPDSLFTPATISAFSSGNFSL